MRAVLALSVLAAVATVPDVAHAGKSWTELRAETGCTFYPIGWQRMMLDGRASFDGCSDRCQTVEAFGQGCTKAVCDQMCHHTWSASDIRAEDKDKRLPNYAGGPQWFWDTMPAPPPESAPDPGFASAVRPDWAHPLDVTVKNQSAYAIKVETEAKQGAFLPSADSADLAPTGAKTFHFDDTPDYLRVKITWLDGLTWRTLVDKPMCRLEREPNCLTAAMLQSYCVTGTPFDGGAKAGGC